MLVLPAAIAAALGCLPAQGTVNPTLLRAPEIGDAAPRGPAATVAKVRASVVHVCIEVDGPRGKFVIERASSGVIVDPSGLVLTWAHLVAEFVGAKDKRLLVQLDDAANTRLQASIVRSDDRTGLALLRVDPPAAGLSALPLGPDLPASGEPAVVLARPEGKDMLAFVGVTSPALAATTHQGVEWSPTELFLTDSRNDERCDGASVVAADGRLLGLYGSDNVKRNEREPTLEDLKEPSFGVVVSAGALRRAFAAEFSATTVKNAGLKRAPAREPVASAQAKAVASIAPSVVSVWAGAGEWPALGARDPGGVQRRAGLGSGVVLTATGLVVTNRHLVDGKEARIRTLDGATYPAKVVRSHGATNLALLQVVLPAGKTLTAAALAPDDDPILGETVLAVGNPMGRKVVVTSGVVSAIRGRSGGRIQADADLGSANGGGAVVDLGGKVIGIGDAGAIDPIEMAFRTRGDRVTTESNLSTFVSIGGLRRAFEDQLQGQLEAGIATPVAQRRSALTAMVESVSGAMLNIHIERNLARQDPDDPFPADPHWVPMSLGSGVVFDPHGLALSNWHVVDDATNPDGSMRADHRVKARVFGGKEYDARVLSISRENDLSLLQLVLAPGEELTAVELGNTDALNIGDPVAAIGNPHGRANTITYGVVSKKGHFMRVKGRWAKLGPMLETDAAINGGNSGGALLDMSGRLVGINSAGGGTFNNVGYAIEVDHVRSTVLGLLFSQYKLRSAALGIDVLDEAGQVLVMTVDERGPAAAAGVRTGDRVVSLAGTRITWSPGFAMTLLSQPAGVELELVVERDGVQQQLRMTPLDAAVWTAMMQSSLQLRTYGYREDPERVRAACIALHRQRTGDPQGEPPVLPEYVVAVDSTFPSASLPPLEVEPGDLLLALEFRSAETGNPVFVDLTSLEQLRDLFNDRFAGKQDGVDHYKVAAEYRCWIARGEALEAVTLRARRLLW